MSDSKPVTTTILGKYPKLAMWWPNTWEQSFDMLERYDWIGLGPWDNEETLSKLKTRNPEQKHFMSLSATETSWKSYQDNKQIYDKIPSEWFLTQMGTVLTQSIDAVQTTVNVREVKDKNGKPLFEENDTITCEFETMKVLQVDDVTSTLVVSRGYFRSATPHTFNTRIAALITFWPQSWVMNMSAMCPHVDIDDGNGPQQWIEFACQHILPEDTWDGYVVDRIEETQGWLANSYCRSIDAACLNELVTDEYEAFDNSWYTGCANFLTFLRDYYVGKPIIANTSGAYYAQLNGAIYEGFPGMWKNEPVTYEEWAWRALGENGYIQVSQSGFSPNLSLTETYEDEEGPGPGGDLNYINPFEQPGFVPNYQKMRYGLTTALLGNGYFSYEINTNGHGSLGLMWFDEYDNAGQGRGYLGSPVAEATTVLNAGDGLVWRRDYENGIAVCNPTNQSVTLNLEKQYRHIQGFQAPEVNTGDVVISVTLRARDGIILLTI